MRNKVISFNHNIFMSRFIWSTDIRIDAATIESPNKSFIEENAFNTAASIAEKLEMDNNSILYEKLYFILLELISNSFDAICDNYLYDDKYKGNINIYVSLDKKNKSFSIEISDNGAGISAMGTTAKNLFRAKYNRNIHVGGRGQGLIRSKSCILYLLKQPESSFELRKHEYGAKAKVKIDTKLVPDDIKGKDSFQEEFLKHFNLQLAL